MLQALKKYRALLLLFLNPLFFSCEKMIDPQHNSSGYPNDIQKIFVNKCAVSGCHNDLSFSNAGNLNLTTYDKLFEGAENGAVVIPYSPVQSSLMQFINTYDDLGLKAEPTMPLNLPVLSKDEVTTVKNWIINGCPDQNGYIPFSDDAETRKKIYISNQGCDIVSVVDAETQLVMRYVSVGHIAGGQPELPHCIRVSPDKKYWYVCFTNGTYFQKFDAATDQLVAELNIGTGAWNILGISADNSRAMLSDFADNGKLKEINLNTMALQNTYGGAGIFNWPHGIAYSKNRDTVYITAQNGNMIYRFIPALPQLDHISLQPGSAPVTTPLLLDPHEILMNSDHSKYFITCQHSNEVRVMRSGADTLLHVIPMGIYPLEMALSKKKNLLFVSCQEDINPVYPAFVGSVYVIDLNTMQVVKKLYEKFYQPHGLAVDDDRNLLFVASRNVNPNGPAPHHSSDCGSRNGFFHVIDINTWQTVRGSSEISVDPYSVDIR